MMDRDSIITHIVNSEVLSCEWEEERPPTEGEYQQMFAQLGLPQEHYILFKEIYDENNSFWWTD